MAQSDEKNWRIVISFENARGGDWHGPLETRRDAEARLKAEENWSRQHAWIEHVPGWEPGYGTFNGRAFRYGSHQAWALNERRTEWHKVTSISDDNVLRQLTKTEFDEHFPNVPPLPPEAFRDDT